MALIRKLERSCLVTFLLLLGGGDVVVGATEKHQSEKIVRMQGDAADSVTACHPRLLLRDNIVFKPDFDAVCLSD